MKLFRDDNTDGYTDDELDTLNDEWEARVTEMGLEEYTEEYYSEAKSFSGEVAGR